MPQESEMHHTPQLSIKIHLWDTKFFEHAIECPQIPWVSGVKY